MIGLLKEKTRETKTPKVGDFLVYYDLVCKDAVGFLAIVTEIAPHICGCGECLSLGTKHISFITVWESSDFPEEHRELFVFHKTSDDVNNNGVIEIPNIITFDSIEEVNKEGVKFYELL